jgi:hypothetical protein
LAELRASARGWHGVQLAVLGFIGLCGVLERSDAADPRWLQVLAGVLVVLAFIFACVAIFLVGRAAWPLYTGRRETGEADELDRTGRRLTAGLVLTFVAVGVLALGTTSSWWPNGETGLVEVQAASGQSWCGRLADARQGALSVDVSGQIVAVPFESLATVSPTDRC